MLCSKANAQSWMKVESLPSIWMTAIAADENRLWVAGTNKLYYISENSTEWDSTEIIHPDLQYISDILIYDNIIFVTDESKGIFKSIDEGQSWEDFNQGLNFTHIIGGTIRGDNIYVGTIGESIFVRNLKMNLGWKAFSSGVRWQNTESITNIGGTLIAGVGSNATLYLNNDQENHWTEIQFAIFNGSPSALLAVAQVENTWIAAGNSGLYASSDEGQNWVQLNLQTGFIGQARLIYHDEIIYAHLAKSIGSSKIFYSSDNGLSWNNFSAPLNPGLDLIFWKDQMWYATQNGLWKLETSTGVDDFENFGLNFKTYPNPFNNQLNIEIEISIPAYYTIALHSISGNQSLIIGDKWMEAGKHYFNWNSEGSLNPGMYILKVCSQNSIKSIKVYKLE